MFYLFYYALISYGWEKLMGKRGEKEEKRRFFKF